MTRPPAPIPRRSRSRSVTIGGVALLLAAGSILTGSTASAVLAGSTFEGSDGNMAVNTAGNTDWANVTGLNTGIDLSSGGGDNAFGQGTKEDSSAVTVVDGSIPPNKNDLTRFYEASKQAADGDIYLDLAWERLVNIGNANLDFEINKTDLSTSLTSGTTGPLTLNRSAGDLLVTYDFSGSGTPTLGLNKWLTTAAGNTVGQCFSANSLPCWGSHVTLNGSNSEGAVNSSSITETTTGGTLGVGLFGEAAINLTDAGVFTAGSCQAFGSAFLKSRSSSSFTAELKDFIAPVPVSISNCGSITVNKVTENGTGSFGYTTTGTLSPTTFSLSGGGTRTYSDLPQGSYSVTENLTSAQVTAGWTLKSLACTPSSAVSVSGSIASITLPLGGNVICTYTNHINLNPTIATVLSATTINATGSVHDSATLSGATATAGGTVTYSAYAGANTCTGTDLLNSTKNVSNGVVPDSASLTLNTAGTYSFQAVYSGDANNNGATSDCTTEQLTVNKLQPSVSTAQTLLPNDAFTLSSATTNAGGHITFSLYIPSDTTCAGPAAFTQQVDVSGNGTYSTTNTAYFVTAVGTWRWESVYSGDTNNKSVTSVCGTERFSIANS